MRGWHTLKEVWGGAADKDYTSVLNFLRFLFSPHLQAEPGAVSLIALASVQYLTVNVIWLITVTVLAE